MRKILLIKLDAIGDYVLFRNFLEETKKKFKKDKIYLMGNVLYKDLAEKYDSKFVDKFIWIDKKDKKSTLKDIEKLNKEKIDILIQPTYLTTSEMDSIAKKINAKEKVTFYGNCKNQGMKQKRKTPQNLYTKFIATSKNLHEFESYKSFFEQFLGTKLKTTLNIKNPKITLKKYAVIFPSASSKFKRWPINNFSKICGFLKEEYGLEIIVCGSKKDSIFAKKLQAKCSFKLIDFTGKKLSILPKIIGNSEILITNDTVAAHIGAATKIKTIIIGTGIYYGRFLPYPKEYSWVKSLTPPFYFKKFHGPIFLIPLKKVKSLIKKILR